MNLKAIAAFFFTGRTFERTKMGSGIQKNYADVIAVLEKRTVDKYYQTVTSKVKVTAHWSQSGY